MKLQTYSSNKWRFSVNRESPSLMYFLSGIYHSFIMNDRFNILNKDTEWYSLSRNDSLDEIKKYRFSFEECCRFRTDEIINRANIENKDIYISLSGGVDSTCVTCAFLLNERLDKSRFHILYNSFSVDEYPKFFEILRKNNIDIIDTKNDINLYNSIPKNNLVINGMCGDQLDGSNLCTSRLPMIPFYENWKDGLMRENTTSPAHPITKYSMMDYYISEIENYANVFNIKLNTFGEFSWLINFGCKWSYVSNFISMLSDYPQDRIAFFDTPYFSNWCLLHLDKMFSRTQKTSWTYKTEWKKIIFKYTKDSDYFFYKGKDHKYLKGEYLNNEIYIKDEEGYKKYSYSSYYSVKDEMIKLFLKYFKDEFKDYISIEEIIWK